MECWTENNWKSCKNSQDGKSNGCDKQTDDFLETFPNFMTLTDEERHEFFQTLYAAKIKLEKSGVTVKPYFGTVHDQSWNSSDVLENKKEKSPDNDISTPSKVETPILKSDTPSHNKISPSVSRSNMMDLRDSVIHENIEKNFKEDKVFPVLSQKNSESSFEMTDSSKNLNFEEEIEVFGKVHENDSLKTLGNSFTTPSFHSNHDSAVIKSVQPDLDLLRIKGTKLKVQVTLTSGDNERMGKVLSKIKAASGDDEKSSGNKPNAFCSKEDKKMEPEDTKSAEEKINDPEPKNLLVVAKENKKADLPEEKEKPRSKIICKKKLFEEDKSKAKKVELEKKKTVLGKGQRGKKEVTRKVPQDQLSHDSECQLKSTILENDTDKMLQRSNTKIITGEEKTKTNVTEQSHNSTQTSRCDLFILKEGSPEPKETTKETQETILEVATVKEGMESNAISEKQETEVAGKKQNKGKSERQMRVEKLQKYLQKREGLYQHKLKIKNEHMKGQAKEKSHDLKKKNSNEESVISPKNSKVVSVNSFIKVKKKAQTSSTSKKKTVPASCSTEEMEEVKKETSETEGGKISYLDSTKILDLTPTEIPLEEKKVTEVSGFVKETPEECVSLPFKRGKVIFIDDDMVEKIKNVILDLEKKAKAYNCDTQNEYLILIVEYVEYLSTVMATLFEDQALNMTTRNLNLKFDEENLADIQQRFRVPTPTIEDEFQSEEELEIRKRRFRKKPWSALILRRLGKFFNCGNRKTQKGCKRQCNC